MSIIYSIGHQDFVDDIAGQIKVSWLPDSSDVEGWGIEESDIEIDADDYDAIPVKVKGSIWKQGGKELRFTAKLVSAETREVRYVKCTMATYAITPR